jgi:hypothetical protein
MVILDGAKNLKFGRKVVHGLFITAKVLYLNFLFKTDGNIAATFHVVTEAASEMITLMMKAESTFETSVSLYQTTRRNIPEDSHLYLSNSTERRRETFVLRTGFESQIPGCVEFQCIELLLYCLILTHPFLQYTKERE